MKFAVGLQEDAFKLSKTASQEFPPEISPLHIRSAISKYEDEMSAGSKRSICFSCGSFVARGDIYEIDDQDDFIILQPISLDQHGNYENSWDFCTFCYAALGRSTIPKFSPGNLVNITMCQNYPSALEDLTIVEERLIAKCHPTGTILKLRLGSYSSLANYNALRGHMILIPQDTGPLLQILPSPELKLDNLISMFWLGKILSNKSGSETVPTGSKG